MTARASPIKMCKKPKYPDPTRTIIMRLPISAMPMTTEMPVTIAAETAAAAIVGENKLVKNTYLVLSGTNKSKGY